MGQISSECAACGKQVIINTRRKQFSCKHCGQRLTFDYTENKSSSLIFSLVSLGLIALGLLQGPLFLVVLGVLVLISVKYLPIFKKVITHTVSDKRVPDFDD